VEVLYHPRDCYLRRRSRKFIVLLFALIGAHLFATLILPGLLPRWGLPRWLGFLSFGPYGGLLAWLIVWANGEWKSVRRRMAAGDVPCWFCGYSLSGQAGESGACPECGRGYEKDGMASAWERTLRRRRG
jgi:hypothetical protein